MVYHIITKAQNDGRSKHFHHTDVLQTSGLVIPTKSSYNCVTTKHEGQTNWKEVKNQICLHHKLLSFRFAVTHSLYHEPDHKKKSINPKPNLIETDETRIALTVLLQQCRIVKPTNEGKRLVTSDHRKVQAIHQYSRPSKLLLLIVNLIS